MNINGIFEKYTHQLDLAGRLCIAFIFIRSPIRKMLEYSRFEGMLESHSIAAELLPVVIIAELGCGIALALGWQTRLAAFLLAGFTALASFIFHWDWEANFYIYVFFSKNIAIFGGLLFIASRGSGKFSLDQYFTGKVTAQDPRR